jgi:ubiquinone/menaquinone biosynthesis C-methylase UbiE
MRADEGYVDLAPPGAAAETHYADHEFQERLAVTDAEPVLSARVKADMMRRMIAPRRGEVILDLGCGAGKLALYATKDTGRAVGVDVAPDFLTRAAAEVELVKGDLRRLPFRKHTFPAAYSLDVLEHLEEDGVREVLLEARRALAADGRLFVYTHAMESSRLAGFQRAVNRLAKRLGRAGLIDHEREAMRKSDHRNAIRNHEHFEALCAAAGLAVAERRYYNVVAKAVVEDLALRLVEQARRRRAGKTPEQAATHGHAHGHGERKVGAPSPPRAVVAAARALTWVLKLDVVLFGGIRTGPFFGLLVPRKTNAPRAIPAAATVTAR